jgi:hypothetical protein
VQIAKIRNVISAPVYLESTSLVFAWGAVSFSPSASSEEKKKKTKKKEKLFYEINLMLSSRLGSIFHSYDASQSLRSPEP